jgi:hypothetical protein
MNLYELAKQQIEVEFEADTREAREKRRAKLEALEKIRPTLENAPAVSPSGIPQGALVNGRSGNDATPTSLNARIREEIMAFGDHERIAMPEVHARLISKYPEIAQMKAGNVRSMIATVLKKFADEQKLYLLVRGRSGQPYVYSKKPALVIDRMPYGGGTAVPISNSGNGFVLRQAMRDFIRDQKGGTFMTRDIVAALVNKYPNEIDKDREPSITAALNKLVRKGELVTTKTDRGRNIYRAASQEARL